MRSEAGRVKSWKALKNGTQTTLCESHTKVLCQSRPIRPRDRGAKTVNGWEDLLRKVKIKVDLELAIRTPNFVRMVGSIRLCRPGCCTILTETKNIGYDIPRFSTLISLLHAQANLCMRLAFDIFIVAWIFAQSLMKGYQGWQRLARWADLENDIVLQGNPATSHRLSDSDKVFMYSLDDDLGLVP